LKLLSRAIISGSTSASRVPFVRTSQQQDPVALGVALPNRSSRSAAKIFGSCAEKESMELIIGPWQQWKLARTKTSGLMVGGNGWRNLPDRRLFWR